MENKQTYCPLCLSESLHNQFLASSSTYTDSIPIQLNISICGECSAYYIENYISESEIGRYYPKSYYTKTNSIDTSSFGFRIRQLSYSIFKRYPYQSKPTIKNLVTSFFYGLFFWHRWARFPKFVNKNKKSKVVEIGYGAGRYLIDLHSLGWDCAGFDVDQSNAQDLKNLGINVASNFTELNFEESSIDFIYSYHAFEHIYDIDSVMRNSNMILSNQGIFKLCVPVSDGFLPKIFKKYWYDLGVPIHKQIYTIKGVNLLAARHGFKVESYKYNSYSESFIGSILAFIIGYTGITNKAPQDFSRNKIFKIFCFLVSPLVVFLDLVKLGDRAEFVLKKK